MMSWKKRKQAAERDYTQAMLPHSRREIFWDVLRLNWRDLLVLGCVFFLFCLPLYLLSVTELLIVNQQLAQAQGLQGQALEAAMYEIYGTKNAGAFLKIPCLLLLCVGLAGLSRIIRQYAWEENVHITTDFAAGLRQDLGQTLLLGLLTGVVYAVNVYNYHTVLAAENGAAAVVLVPMSVAVLVGIPVAAYGLVNLSVYKTSFRKVLHMGLLLYGQAPLATLGILLCGALPFGLLLIPSFPVVVIAGFALCVAFPVLYLGWYLFALEQQDRAVNRRLFPELVGKGTVPAGPETVD